MSTSTATSPTLHMFAVNIREHLKKHGLTRNSVSTAAEINQSYFTMVLNEGHSPTIDKAAEFAKAINIPLWQLLIHGRTASDASAAKLERIVIAYLNGDTATRMRLERNAGIKPKKASK